MPRVQINIEGTGTGFNQRWAVTTQWATSSLPANEAALQAILTTARNTLAASTPFKAGVEAANSVTRLHGLAYPTPGGVASFVADSSGAAFAGTHNVAVPPQIATVVTERTGASGPSYRGRSFWPYRLARADGVMQAADTTAVGASWMAAHSAILSALAGAGLSPVHVVFSRKTLDMTPITRIGIGNRADTLRRRTGDTPETYTYTDLPESLLVAPLELGGDLTGFDAAQLREFAARLSNSPAKGLPLLGPPQVAVPYATALTVIEILEEEE